MYHIDTEQYSLSPSTSQRSSSSSASSTPTSVFSGSSAPTSPTNEGPPLPKAHVLSVVLLHKPRGSKGVWYPISQGDHIRVTKGKGKRLKLEVRSATDLAQEVLVSLVLDGGSQILSSGSDSGLLVESIRTLPPPPPPAQPTGISVTELSLKLSRLSRRLSILVRTKVRDNPSCVLEARSIEFSAHNNGKESTIHTSGGINRPSSPINSTSVVTSSTSSPYPQTLSPTAKNEVKLQLPSPSKNNTLNSSDTILPPSPNQVPDTTYYPTKSTEKRPATNISTNPNVIDYNTIQNGIAMNGMPQSLPPASPTTCAPSPSPLMQPTSPNGIYSHQMPPNMVPIKFEQIPSYYQLPPQPLHMLSHPLPQHNYQHYSPSAMVDQPLMNIPDQQPVNSQDLESERKRKRHMPSEDNVGNMAGISPSVNKQRLNSAANGGQSGYKSTNTSKPATRSTTNNMKHTNPQSEIYPLHASNTAVLVPSNSPNHESNSDVEPMDHNINKNLVYDTNPNTVPPLPLSNPNSPQHLAEQQTQNQPGQPQTISLHGGLDVKGIVRAQGFLQYSDARLKTDIEDLADALSIVSSLEGKSYCWKQDQSIVANKGSKRVIGLIAQEVQKILPEVVHEENGYLSVAYAEIVPVLIEALKQHLANDAADKQEVKMQIHELDSKLESLIKEQDQWKSYYHTMAAMRVLSLWGTPGAPLWNPTSPPALTLTHTQSSHPHIRPISPHNAVVINRTYSQVSIPPALAYQQHFAQNYVHSKASVYTPIVSSSSSKSLLQHNSAYGLRHWCSLIGFLLGACLFITGIVLLIQTSRDHIPSPPTRSSKQEVSIVLVGLGVVCLISVFIFYLCSKIRRRSHDRPGYDDSASIIPKVV